MLRGVCRCMIHSHLDVISQEKNRFRSLRGARQQSKPILEHEMDHEKVALDARNALVKPPVHVIDIQDNEYAFKSQVAVVEKGQGKVREALHEIDTIIQNSQDLSDKFSASPRKFSAGSTDCGYTKSDTLRFDNDPIGDYDFPSQSGLPLSRTTDSWGEDPIGDDDFVPVNEKASCDGSPVLTENRPQEQLNGGNHEHLRMFSIQENGHVTDETNALHEVRARLAEMTISKAEKNKGLRSKQSRVVTSTSCSAADRILSKEAHKPTANHDDYGFSHPYASGFDSSEVPKELSIEEISHDLDDDTNNPEPNGNVMATESIPIKSMPKTSSRFVTRGDRRDSDMSNQDDIIVRHAPTALDTKKNTLINQGMNPTSAATNNKTIQFVSRKYLPGSDTSDEEGEIGQWTHLNCNVKKIETQCSPLRRSLTPRSHSNRSDKLQSMVCIVLQYFNLIREFKCGIWMQAKDAGIQDSAVIPSQVRIVWSYTVK